MIIDNHYAILTIENCVRISQLRRDLHAGFETTLALLEKEGVRVYRFRSGSRYRQYVTEGDAKRMVRLHGSEAARERRRRRSAVRAKGLPLPQACPHCGKKGHQWRSGLNPDGKRHVQCGHCKRSYTIGKRPALVATCFHCGATERQWRKQLTSVGNVTVKCGVCLRHYTLVGNPDERLDVAPRPPKGGARHDVSQEREDGWIVVSRPRESEWGRGRKPRRWDDC